MNKILIFILVSCILLVFSNIPVKSSEILTPANEHTYEWHLWRWNEFINIDENGNADGFILIEFEFLEENSTQDIDFEIEIPAYNETLELFSANNSVVSFSRVGCEEGVDLKIFFEKSITKTYRFFEIAVSYKIKKDIILKQTSEWFENFIRYRFSYIVHINDEFLPSYKEEKSPIINIYLSFPEYSSYSTPNNFSYFSRERLPHISSIEGRNQSGYAICNTPLPDIKINKLNSVYLRYRSGSSPGEIIFDYSYTNYIIVIVIFAAVFIGLISSILGIISFFRKRCYNILNKKDKNYICKYDDKFNLGRRYHNKAYDLIIIGIFSYAILFFFVLFQNPNKEFEIYSVLLTAIPTIILITATVMYVESSFRLVNETQLQRKKEFIKEIIKKILLPLLSTVDRYIDWSEKNDVFRIKDRKCYMHSIKIKKCVFSKHPEVFYKLFKKRYFGLSKKIEDYDKMTHELGLEYCTIIEKINTKKFRTNWEKKVNMYQNKVKGKNLFSELPLFPKSIDNILESIIKKQKIHNLPDLFWKENQKEINLEIQTYNEDIKKVENKIKEVKELLDTIKKDLVGVIIQEQEKFGILALE